MRGIPELPEDLRNLDPFYAGFMNTVLIKAEEEGRNWVIYLEASNENKDLEDDVTVMKALKDASDYYLTHGVISWDHKHKPSPEGHPGDPGCIIGEPMDVAFTEGRSTLVKGLLYKENKKAQGVWENVMSRTTRLGSSIGGYILKKAVQTAQSLIRRVIWDDTAITYKPVNDSTLGRVQVVPFAAFAKALMAGTGVNAGVMGGGRALTPESLQVKTTNMLFKDFLTKVKAGKLSEYKDVKAWVQSHNLSEEVGDEIMNFILATLTAGKGK